MNPAFIDALWARARRDNLQFGGDPVLVQFARLLRAEVRRQALEEAAAACGGKVTRPAGYGGQWEGYGALQTSMTGPECAAAIRALGDSDA